MKNFSLFDTTEFKSICQQDLKSSDVRVIKELTKVDYNDYRYKRARFYFSKVTERRCNINMSVSVNGKDKQLIHFYLRKRKSEKTKLTAIDILIIEYALGLANRDDLANLISHHQHHQPQVST